MKENMFNQFEFSEELKEKLVLFVVYQNAIQGFGKIVTQHPANKD